MHSFSKLVLSALAFPLAAQGAVFYETFDGSTLDDTSFQTPLSSSGNVTFSANPSGSRLDFVSTGTLTGAHNSVRFFHQESGLVGDAWSFSADVHLTSVSSFAFAAGDIIDLQLRATSSLDSNDSLEFNFVAGDPFGGGAIHGVRFGKQTDSVDLDEAFDLGLGTEALSGTIRMSYSPLTHLVTATYVFGGGGETLLGTTDISDWGVTSSDRFIFNIEGGALNVNDQTVDGAFAISSGQAYFSNALVTIPEPASAMLLGVAAVTLLGRRRRFP
jgi:hypothetical protein